MYSKAFKKIEYYLYTYNDIDTQIKELKEKMINYEYNQNYGRWIKNKSSSLEDFIIRNDNLKEVIITKCKWKKIIIRVLNKYQKEDKLKYKFINLKYFNKENKFNIKEKIKLSFEEQKNMQDEILQYIFALAIQNGMLKEAIF